VAWRRAGLLTLGIVAVVVGGLQLEGMRVRLCSACVVVTIGLVLVVADAGAVR
jgi:hypothetical protein